MTNKEAKILLERAKSLLWELDVDSLMREAIGKAILALEELPETGEKYIRIEEIKSGIKGWISEKKYYHPNSKCKNIPISEVFDILDVMPKVRLSENGVIEALKRERREKAKWEKPSEYSETICSDCKNSPKTLFGYLPNYCPNCGAKMGEEQ